MNRDSRIVEIELDKIVPNRFQPRKVFNEDVSELAESIHQHGVLQPITVRPLGEKYEIIMGERRYRACERLGMKTIPSMIVEMNDRESMEVALIENLQRQNLNPIEEALSYKRILDAGFTTQDQLAVKLGKTQSTVANKLRLLSLDKEIQNALLRGEISERHARSILRLSKKEQQKELLNKIITERLTVKKTDEEIRKMERDTNINRGSVEIIDFDDNPFKGFEIPKAVQPVSEPKSRNIPISGIIEDSVGEKISDMLEPNYGYLNNQTFKEEQVAENTEKSMQMDILPKMPTFDDLVSETSNNTPDIEKIKGIINESVKKIEALGYKVTTENFDFETMFQTILKVSKK